MTEYGDIYLMRSKGDNIPYVGVTKEIYNRKCNHFSMIDRRKHHSKKINDYCHKNNKTSSDFYISIIEKSVSAKSLYSREKYWINFYNSLEYGFNSKNGNYNPNTLIGEKHPLTKLTDDAFRNIIDLYLSEDYTVSKLSKMFNISFSSINRVLHGHNRKHLVDTIELEKIRAIAKKRHGTHNNHAGDKIIWNGIEYKNKVQCAKAIGVKYSTFCKRLNGVKKTI